MQQHFEFDKNYYSSQIAAIGRDTQEKLGNLNVLIYGLRGLGVEVAKNLILTGPRSVFIFDEELVTMNDLGSNFYTREWHVGKVSRADASLSELKDLNPYVRVEVYKGILTPESISEQFQVVVLTDTWNKKLIQQMNEAIRVKKGGFIFAHSSGLFGSIFVDFSHVILFQFKNFSINDATGEDLKSIMIESISQDVNGVVATIRDIRHGFEDNDFVTFREVVGMTEVNEKEFQIKVFYSQFQVLSPFVFSIGDTSKFGKYQRGGIVIQVKKKKQIAFKSFELSLTHPSPVQKIDFVESNHKERPQLLHIALKAMFHFVKINGFLPELNNEEHAEQVWIMAQEIHFTVSGESADIPVLDEKIIKNAARYSRAQISPTVSFWGGIVAQEIIKFTGKFTPIIQWLHHDFFEALPEYPTDRAPQGSYYDDYIAIFGRDTVAKIQNQRAFIAGAGALGCEYIKMFSLMGLGSGLNGQVNVADDDKIEVSNLNRQFLFKHQNVGLNKVSIATSQGEKFNPTVKFQFYIMRVSNENESIFHDGFWEGLDLVVSAVDNYKSRRYIDYQCCYYHKPLFEGGTLSTKCSSQVIIPNQTQSYSESEDPIEERTPLDTILNFPNQIEHAIFWANYKFKKLFIEDYQEYIQYLENPKEYIEKINFELGNQTGILLSKLQSIKKYSEISMAPTFEKCVELTRNIFEDLFHNQIIQLLHHFPLDLVTNEGHLFWSNPKRPPQALKFDINDEIHFLFLQNGANTIAHMYKLPLEENKGKLREIIKQIKVEEFLLANGKRNEDDEKQYIEQLANYLKELQITYKFNQIIQKDDKFNQHIQFITALANLKARNYQIQEFDELTVQLKLGKITPAIVTTAAVIVGATGIEIIKYIQGKNVDKMRNYFINSALPLFISSEPLPPRTHQDKAYDHIILGPTKAVPPKWTNWDMIMVPGNKTIAEFIEYFKQTYDIDVHLITAGQKMLFCSFLKSQLVKQYLNQQDQIQNQKNNIQRQLVNCPQIGDFQIQLQEVIQMLMDQNLMLICLQQDMNIKINDIKYYEYIVIVCCLQNDLNRNHETLKIFPWLFISGHNIKKICRLQQFINKNTMILYILSLISLSIQQCFHDNYESCMNTPQDYCIYDKEKRLCRQSNSTIFGCLSTLNQNLCLIQNKEFQCQYLNGCRTIDKQILRQIGCEKRLLSQGSCLQVTDLCVWNNEQNRCKTYLQIPIIQGKCRLEKSEGNPLIITPLVCSQIADMSCIWDQNDSNCLDYQNFSSGVCEEIGLSRPACIQIKTSGQNCIYREQNNCKNDCPNICQQTQLDKCDLGMNQNACFNVQSESCSFTDGGCSQIKIQKCNRKLVNPRACINVEQELCKIQITLGFYNKETFSCEIPNQAVNFQCDSVGINKLLCLQIQDLCIFENECRYVTNQELYSLQCTDIVTKLTCLSIKTEQQYCQWNEQQKICQEILISKQTQCNQLKLVNGNSCKTVIYDPCKYDKFNCITASKGDSCETDYINFLGCSQIIKFQMACQWKENRCQRAQLVQNQRCEDLQLVNPITCSMYFVFNVESDFKCYYDDQFRWFSYTCRYDEDIRGCRQLRQEEISTLKCGDSQLGLNAYACSLIQTPGQVCRFRNSQCTASDQSQQNQIQCGIIQYGNPLSCAYTTFQQQPCKFNINKCGCIQSTNIYQDKCNTLGLNAIGCSQLQTEKCYFDTNQIFSCKPKQQDVINIKCEQNFPNQKLCVTVTTKGELCKWSNFDQICKYMSVDPSQSCQFFTLINPNVCTYVEQMNPNENNRGYCYYDEESQSCRSWSLNKKCVQSCCSDVMGINIHVCSGKTNFDDAFCYFENQKCNQYQIQNQLDFQKIQVLFENYRCEQFNFKMCGLINPDRDNIFYCYQSSPSDRCRTLEQLEYIGFDKTQLLLEQVRSNVWTCIQIDDFTLRVYYDSSVGQCKQIAQSIACQEYLINKQACLQLTQKSLCQWDPVNYQCLEIINFDSITCNSLINKNTCLTMKQCRYNNILLQCEDIQTIDQSTQCQQLSQDYSYHDSICKIVDDGTPCVYDYQQQGCKTNTEYIQNCNLYGQNKQSCLQNTLGTCKWNQQSLLCEDIDFDSNSGCDSNFNKYSCMKVTSQKCFFDTTCQQFTQIFSCDELVLQSQLLLKYFNKLSCISIDVPGQLCAYDLKNFRCINSFLDQNNQQIQNYKCTQFPMNIHLCLSYTQGSYCYYNTTTYQCSDYQLDQPYQNCSSTNLNRDVCVSSLSSCKFDKFTSKCQIFEYNQEYCTDLKSTPTLLYGQMACKMVQNPKQLEFKDLYKLCHAYQCDFQQYCQYDQDEQGCKIIQYVEAQYKFVDDQKNCYDKKRVLKCDKSFNKYGCLYLTDYPCYFDPIDNTCKDLDQSNINIAQCTEVSYLGCMQIKTIGQNCFLLVQDVIPYSCNFGLKQFQVCQNIEQAPPIVVDQATQYTYDQCEYFTLNDVKVNPNTCSQLKNCKAIFDEEFEECEQVDLVIGCTNPGQTEQLCNLNQPQGCVFNNVLNSCQKISANTQNSNCSSILTFKDYDQPTVFNQAMECAYMPNCAFYNQDHITDLPIYYANLTHCIDELKIFDQQYNDCTQPYSCSILTNYEDCYAECVINNRDDYNDPNFPYINYTVGCLTGFWDYQISCQCKADRQQQCRDKVDSKRQVYINDPQYKQSCRQYQFQCQPNNLITDDTQIISTYLMMPQKLCTELNGFSAKYINANFTCLQTENITRCAGNNKLACLRYSADLYCMWANSRCQKIRHYELKGITDCAVVNLNSCYQIGAICQIQDYQCQTQIDIGSCDSDIKILSEFTCSQLKENQCVFNNEIGYCQSIKNKLQLYSCNTPGLNNNACLINTKQYCIFQNTCQQITDLTVVGCQGLNLKGCIEHALLPCIWDNIKLECSRITFTLNPTCNQFQSTMPLDYYVNKIACFQIVNVPCIYKDQQCKIPIEENGCKSEIYNYQACLQSTNEFCQAEIGKIDFTTSAPLLVYCFQIGAIPQGCQPYLNKYACIQILGCMFKDNICQQYTQQYENQLFQFNVNPYICQNTNGKSLVYKNNKCDLATEFFECQTPYINKETCLSRTKGYCQYIQASTLNFKDTEQRCVQYQNFRLFLQQCDDSINFKACSDLDNYACVFKGGVCQQFNQSEDTCFTLSQPGVYASVQACAQTQDSKCAYDVQNKRCQIISDISAINCDTIGINYQSCVQVIKQNNKCEFITSQFQQSTKKQCNFATQQYKDCNVVVSMNQCVLIDNCKFYNDKCQIVNQNDSQTCIKQFEVNEKICSLAEDLPCDYDPKTFKCISNPPPLNEYYQNLNKLACILNQINKSLIFINNKCQLVDDMTTINCNQDINQFACKNTNLNNKCIFKQKCSSEISTFCEQNSIINNPEICSMTKDIPCKYLNNKCVTAQNTQSECISQGLNILACLQSNLISCKQCSEIILNSNCIQADSQKLCLSLLQPCIWQQNKCANFVYSHQQCHELPSGVNKYACFQIPMQIDQECIYDEQSKACKQQGVTKCENLNSLSSCTLNTKLKCVWFNSQCIQKDPIKYLDKCESYQSSLQFCKAIERFDSDCEFIDGVCQESQFKQADWQKYVNRQSCIKQRFKYCYWNNIECLCLDQDALVQLQQQQKCNQNLSFLLCLSIQTQSEFCQFNHGQCNSIIIEDNLQWNQYALVNPNLCTQVSIYPVIYNEQTFCCNIVRDNVYNCDVLGLNKIGCQYNNQQSCVWINDRCVMRNPIINDNSRMLQEQEMIVNPMYCSLSIEPVYYQDSKCLYVGVNTRCNAIGISKNGCFNVQFEPCRWYEDQQLCELTYPIEECELNPILVNAIFCSKVEIGRCKYDQINNKCIEPKSESSISDPGLNQLACIQINQAIFDGRCTIMKSNSNCPLFKQSNLFACKLAIDPCVYDPIDNYCSRINYFENCNDLTISKAGCQQLQDKHCVYMNDNCTCNSLVQIQCLYTNYQQCQRNNLCYWESNQCEIIQCSGATENCQTQKNCYQIYKNQQSTCQYASKCEDIIFDSKLYKGCSDIIINDVPCVSAQNGCKTFDCSSLLSKECQNSYFGDFLSFNHCVVNGDVCVEKKCIDIHSEVECVKRPDCLYFLQINNQWGCQQFTSCQDAEQIGYKDQENLCNQISVLSNQQYLPCSWIQDKCVMNPCIYIGADKTQCNGVHINNKYVCALNSNNLICNVCEMYNNGCDCLTNDMYCQWNTNKSICESIPCQNIQSKDQCGSRQDCQYNDMGYCKTRCQFHFNKYYCNQNNCFWDDNESKCSSCDINLCKDYACLNKECCKHTKEVLYGTEYTYCVPICERITKQQCYSQCSWSSKWETCIENESKSNNISNVDDVQPITSDFGYLISVLIVIL